MRRIAFIGLLWTSVGWLGSVRADEVDDILARARKAHLGSVSLLEADAIVKVKGKINIDDDLVPFDGEFAVHPGQQDGNTSRNQLRLRIRLSSIGREFTLVGDKCPGLLEAIDDLLPYQYIDIKNSPQIIRSALLAALVEPWGKKADLHPPIPPKRPGRPSLPVLIIKGEVTELLGESKFGDRTVIGVQRKTLPVPATQTYYFDKETGCLLKLVIDRQREVVFGDHGMLKAGAADDIILKQAGVFTNVKGVAEFLKSQLPDMATAEKIKALIIKLGDDEYAVREKASKAVVAVGPPALSLLDKATKSSDPEIALRALVAAVEIRKQNNALTRTAVRALARQKPANATETLLSSLSGADEDVVVEIRAALLTLARNNGKVDPVLEKALTDNDCEKRAAAEAVLGKDGGAYLKKPGRRLYPENSRFPAKATILGDGKIIAEIEFVDVQFFNRLPDRAFEKP